MELLLDHLKAEISTLSGSLPDLKHFIKDYIATKDTDERLTCLRVTLKLDRWGEKISLYAWFVVYRCGCHITFFPAALPEIQPTSDEYSSGSLTIELLQGALEFALTNGFFYNELGPFLTLYLHTLGLVNNGEDTRVAYYQYIRPSLKIRSSQNNLHCRLSNFCASQ